MATRKIRLTMSGTLANDQGPIVDVDFNGVNLDVDVDIDAVHGSSTVVKEYTVDVDAGTYNLDITYKNDRGGDTDRNFYIDKIEFANDGINYEPLIVHEGNSNLTLWNNFDWMGYVPMLDDAGEKIANPDCNSSLPYTDNNLTWDGITPPGNNYTRIYEIKTSPVKIWTSKTATFNITFI